MSEPKATGFVPRWVCELSPEELETMSAFGGHCSNAEAMDEPEPAAPSVSDGLGGWLAEYAARRAIP